ncbi:MAG: DegT/DnrJ/EryC1/StrS family aminotransferase, partial [Cyclobacteriaceae bacterium]
EIANKYLEAFEGLPLTFQAIPDGCDHAYHLFVIQVDDRLGLYEHLKQNGIHAQVHYIPVHLNPYYQNMGWKKGDFPVAEAYYEKCLSLPMYPTLTEVEQDFVIQKVKEFVK